MKQHPEKLEKNLHRFISFLIKLKLLSI